jgi:Ca2+-binding EF-hand superfamily protein
MGAIQTFKPDLKYVDFGTMGRTGFRANQFSAYDRDEKKTGMKNAPDPRTQTTQQFYVDNGKRVKAPTAIIAKRTTYLENNKWTDNVFTGDKPDFQQDLTAKVKKRITKLGLSNAGKMKMPGLDEVSVMKTERKFSKTADSQRSVLQRKSTNVKPTTFSKIDVHAVADLETQLVFLDNKSTLKGKVDLKKVRDIRRAIRRRYATRKNATKLFHAWDLKQQKKIDTDDILNMVIKIGIKINKDEAYVLLKSADINNDDNLNIEEFISLIHSTNEALDVDLQHLAPINDAINHEISKSRAIGQLQQKASGRNDNPLDDNQMNPSTQNGSETLARE